MPTTTKKELAKLLSDELDITFIQAQECVDAFFTALRESVIQGKRIEARGFGSWEVRKTNPKLYARNPRTGEVVFVPARRKVRFKPGKELKKELMKSMEVEVVPSQGQ